MVHASGDRNRYLEQRARLYLLAAVGGTAGLLLAALLAHPLFLILLPIPLLYCPGKHRAYAAGIRGENAVGSVLSAFDDRWYLFNSVCLPGADGDIDHVLVGPKGVFVLETKNYAGFIACRQDAWYRKVRERWIPLGRSPSRQAKYNATVLARFLREKNLGEWVYAVIVFANPAMKSIIEDSTVDIVYRDELTRHILSYPDILSEKRAAAIASAIAGTGKKSGVF
ncbi:MAG: NERD domain-containing protein [Methanomicrobiales archaeon]|nr:NERD domain-containing protein [Methanomicrobiales archaeon]